MPVYVLEAYFVGALVVLVTENASASPYALTFAVTLSKRHLHTPERTCAAYPYIRTSSF